MRAHDRGPTRINRAGVLSGIAQSIAEVNGAEAADFFLGEKFLHFQRQCADTFGNLLATSDPKGFVRRGTASAFPTYRTRAG